MQPNQRKTRIAELNFGEVVHCCAHYCEMLSARDRELPVLGQSCVFLTILLKNLKYPPRENACDTRRSMLTIIGVIKEMSFFDHHLPKPT